MIAQHHARLLHEAVDRIVPESTYAQPASAEAGRDACRRADLPTQVHSGYIPRARGVHAILRAITTCDEIGVDQGVSTSVLSSLVKASSARRSSATAASRIEPASWIADAVTTRAFLGGGTGASGRTPATPPLRRSAHPGAPPVR